MRSTVLLCATLALASTGLQAQSTTHTEGVALYCEALLGPQIEVINGYPKELKSNPVILRDSIRRQNDYSRIQRFLVSRNVQIDKSELERIRANVKDDINAANALEQSCSNECQQKIPKGIPAERYTQEQLICIRGSTRCASDIRARLDRCSDTSWLP